MYAITGITGKVGGVAARTLLAKGLPVRAVLRDEAKAQPWRDRGCEIAVATMDDAVALAAAFEGATGVFVLPPSEFDPAPGFPEARREIDAVHAALAQAQPGKVVCLSTIGADAPHENLLSPRTLLEQALCTLTLPVAFLRAAWFMDNVAWDIPAARDERVLRSFLQPADRPIPMVATRDVGRVAAELLADDWRGTRVVELEGPSPLSPRDVAHALAHVLGHPVDVEAVPRERWDAIFRGQGARNPLPRIRMLDGFNEGWIAFDERNAGRLKGRVTLEQVIAELLAPR